jgi:hypothetical protein
MNAKGVINGTGNNNCSPTATATRQEAIIIAVHMVEKLKGVTLDYTQSGTTQPTQPPSGDNSLIGRWLCHYDFPYIDEVFFFDENGTFI